MSDSSVNILVGGEAGQGLATIGQLMAKALVRTGYEVLVVQEYLSRIRGGHNTFSIRTGPEPLGGPAGQVDILVALDAETVTLHQGRLSERAVVVADEAIAVAHHRCLRVPFNQLAPKPIFTNTVALGVLSSVLCNDLAVLEDLLRETFAKKGEAVVEENLKVLRDAHAWATGMKVAFACMPPAPAKPKSRIMLNGNEAIALGALAAGCNFCSFYPMTPATSIALTLINKGKALNVVSEQAEDEIAAINMALGASFAGARPLVPTSGGGFALMCEGLSLAGITETPVVIALAQRPGPATGLPTRTEQADLNMVVFAGHGEFPRAVFAPGSVEQCFHLTHHAFAMAEAWQVPAFVLTDQYLADSYRAVEPFDPDDLPEIPGPVLAPESPETYRRYEITEDGVSPRAVPGLSPALVRADSDEHGPEGCIIEDPATRIAMNEKRLRKHVRLKAEVLPPTLYGDAGADLLLVCWGSGLGPCLEAAEALKARGVWAGVLHFTQVWPLNDTAFAPYLDAAKTVVVAEGNATGQLASLIARESGRRIDNRILRHDGLPLDAGYILASLEYILWPPRSDS
ncbi:MAG: 2-oxoacid:acceptor oxidoreductase subunit alpha [Desulfovibrionaceae bacterium]